MIELNLEQEFTVASFNSSVDQMSEEQVRAFIKKLFKSYLVQEITYKEMIKQQWGL